MEPDLYTTWMDVSASCGRPPDHYALLGIPLFCADREVIERATRDQLAKLDRRRLHPNREKREACARMTTEVAQARTVLVDLIQREAYDRKLRGDTTVTAPEAPAVREHVGLMGRSTSAISAAEQLARGMTAPALEAPRRPSGLRPPPSPEPAPLRPPPRPSVENPRPPQRPKAAPPPQPAPLVSAPVMDAPVAAAAPSLPSWRRPTFILTAFGGVALLVGGMVLFMARNRKSGSTVVEAATAVHRPSTAPAPAPVSKSASVAAEKARTPTQQLVVSRLPVTYLPAAPIIVLQLRPTAGGAARSSKAVVDDTDGAFARTLGIPLRDVRELALGTDGDVTVMAIVGSIGLDGAAAARALGLGPGSAYRGIKLYTAMEGDGCLAALAYDVVVWASNEQALIAAVERSEQAARARYTQPALPDTPFVLTTTNPAMALDAWDQPECSRILDIAAPGAHILPLLAALWTPAMQGTAVDALCTVQDTPRGTRYSLAVHAASAKKTPPLMDGWVAVKQEFVLRRDWQTRLSHEAGEEPAESELALLAELGGASIVRTAKGADFTVTLSPLADGILGAPGALAFLQPAHADLRTRAATGDAEAMYVLARYYENADGAIHDLAQAQTWYSSAAKGGYAAAATKLATMYLDGRGVKRDLRHAAKLLEQGVAGNDAEAMVRLASLLEGTTLGATPDLVRARALYSRAAELGNIDAMNSLGLALRTGSGGNEDPVAAAAWYRKAAERGHTAAAGNLAYLYDNGYGVAQDYAQAHHWYTIAGEKGDIRAMAAVGRMYRQGAGCAKDDAQALKWLLRAADGHSTDPVDRKAQGEAMYSLGQMYDGAQGVPRDVVAAAKWFRAAAERDHAAAARRIGLMCHEGTGVILDLATARNWYRKAAEGGDIYGACYYAEMCRDGKGGPADLTSAAQYFQIAADAENIRGMYHMAELYSRGRGVEVNALAATTLAKKIQQSANGGDREAMFYLGLAFEHGIGFQVNYDGAFIWFSKAAGMGDLNSMRSLGKMFEQGLGRDPNMEAARRWYQKAADGGSELGRKWIETH